MTALQTSFSYKKALQTEPQFNGKPVHDGVTKDLLAFVGSRRFGTILVDPPWQFQNRTGKIAPEHKRLSRCSAPHRIISRAGEFDQTQISKYLKLLAHLRSHVLIVRMKTL